MINAKLATKSYPHRQTSEGSDDILHLLNKGWWAVPILRNNKLFRLLFSQQGLGARYEPPRIASDA